jgi:hypothetical protein
MITAERLRELLDYDGETGVFRWRSNRGRMAKLGQQAGSSNSSGYVLIRIDGKDYRAHRLAWLHVNGAWPQDEIDHINCNRSDNRIGNIREASHSQNNANRPRYKNNRSGFKGVAWHAKTGRWRAEIRLSRRSRHLGLFDTPEAAHSAYMDAASRLFGEFARAG